ncbi:MAG: PIN domain-containing protein [Candidatus Dadabacteria bacterium]|nr:PIN domain-containing protein [Candidatus Dadabacteria bacterium]MDE0519269.1 PIN domain-containing protein [Candidatus Dadabacteria bacterium]MDE0663076.1 PIN domain-containing protein [Candidatus Dadabacteria bacterium]
MLFADTSVWSLALRRDPSPEVPHVRRLRDALSGGEAVHTTGIVLQELLQGYRGPRAKAQIVERFTALALIVPARDDHIDAAELRNTCRHHGIQVGTIDALLAQLCIRHNLVMLTTDRDFSHISEWTPLQLWRA